MALRRRPPVQRPKRAITAAGRRIAMTGDQAQKQYQQRGQDWQNEAWRYYHEIGEVWFGTELAANALRRLRIFPATQSQPDEEPVPLEVGPLAAAAEAELARLRLAAGGGQLLHDITVQLDIPADCTLVGFQEDEMERWQVFSHSALQMRDMRWVMFGFPDDREGIPLDPETTVMIRLWRPDPEWPGLALGPMRPVLDACDKMQITSRLVRSSMRSRVALAGMLLFPSEASPPDMDPSDEVDPTTSNVFIDDVMKAAAVSLQDEGSAAAMVPVMAEMAGDEIAKVRLIEFKSNLDPEVVKQEAIALGRIVNGMDYPKELILGLGEGHVNFATAWQIDAQAFKAHLEPRAINIVESLTMGFLQPALREKGVPGWENVFLWYDPDAVISHPNMQMDVKDAWDRIVVSDETLRRTLGFSDDDAPDDEEKAERIARAKPASPFGAPAPGPDEPVVDEQPVEEPPPSGAPDANPPTDNVTIQAAAVPSLGQTMADIDRDLMIQLQVAADATVHRALERAGATLRRKAGNTEGLAAMIKDIPNELVAFKLGKRVALADTTDDALLAASIAALGPKYDQLTARAQKRLRALADRNGEIDDADLERVEEKQELDRKAGWNVLAVALLAVASKKLFSPERVEPSIGEFDDAFTVQVGVIRNALARAGGAEGPATRTGTINAQLGTKPAFGLTTGTTTLDLMAEAGLTVSSSTWQYNDVGQKMFEPHFDLDGEPFINWDDPVLAVTAEGEWTEAGDTGFYKPNDHVGCMCDVIQNFDSNAQEQAA